MMEIHAIIAPLKTAVQIHPEGGGRITLDVDEQSWRRLWPMLPDLRDCLLVVNIRREGEGESR